MSKTKVISPTGSFSLAVPIDVEEDVDDGTLSVWLPGDHTLLQISSRRRESGEQVCACERMETRLEAEGVSNARVVDVDIADCDDLSAAALIDKDGTSWLYSYAVWPDLSIFVSLSHPDHDVTTPSWALEALRSLRRN